MEDGICPDYLLPLRDITCIFCNLPKEVGMMPVSRLSSMVKTAKLIKFPISFGMLPTILLESKYICLIWVERLPTVSGKTPPKLFIPRSKYSNLLQFTRVGKKAKSSLELLPKRFCPNPSHQRSCRLPKLVGSGLTKLLPKISRT